MPVTYEVLAATTLGSATNAITFSSISQSYTDLRIVLAANAVNSFGDAFLRFNGDASNIYHGIVLRASGSASVQNEISQSRLNLSPSLADYRTITIDVFNYTSTGMNKCVQVIEGHPSQAAVRLGTWYSTAAINSVTLGIASDNFTIGSQASLYGILRA